MHSTQCTSPLDGSCDTDTGGPSQCPMEFKGEEPRESSSKRAVLGTAVPADLRRAVSPLPLGCTRLYTAHGSSTPTGAQSTVAAQALSTARQTTDITHAAQP